MDYKVTCICGQPFLVSDEKIRASGGIVNCPACQRLLSPAIEASMPPAAPTPTPAEPPAQPPAAQTTSAAASADPPTTPAVAPTTPAAASMTAAAAPGPEATKRCPFCGEVILAIARKCKHCGEFLDRPIHSPAADFKPLSPATPPSAPLGKLAVPPPHDASEDPVFILTISQWDNFWRFLSLFCVVVFVAFITTLIEELRPFAMPAVLVALLLAGALGWFFYFRATCTRVIIRPLGIEVERGIFGKKVTALELFRVTDISLEQSFFPRMLGFGTIKLTTTDADSPELFLYQIPHVRKVRQYLQTQVPLAAKTRGAFYVEK